MMETPGFLYSILISSYLGEDFPTVASGKVVRRTLFPMGLNWMAQSVTRRFHHHNGCQAVCCLYLSGLKTVPLDMLTVLA